MDILNITFDDIFNKIKKHEFADSLEEEVIIVEIKYVEGRAVHPPAPAIRVDAMVFFLCCYGDISFTIDYKTYHLSKGMGFGFGNHYVINNVKPSNNNRGYALIVSRQFMQSFINEVPSIVTEMMDVHFSGMPMQYSDEEMNVLTNIIERIRKQLKTTDNIFRRNVVKNELSNFIMEAAYYLLRKTIAETPNNPEKKNQKEKMVQDFIRLVFGNFRKQHEVSFYAKELCMTSGNLTRILTAASGKSPMKWIHDALIAEAKILLRRPDMNIQQISDELHFGDQSSFGKFFKKHTGLTPLEYKTKIREAEGA